MNARGIGVSLFLLGLALGGYWLFTTGGKTDVAGSDSFHFAARLPVGPVSSFEGAKVSAPSLSGVTPIGTTEKSGLTKKNQPSSSVSPQNFSSDHVSPESSTILEIPPPAENTPPLVPCAFENGGTPSRTQVVINEIVWMGSASSANHEWIELRNLTNTFLSLAGWRLFDEGGHINITFGVEDRIAAEGYYLLERGTDASMPAVAADKIYTGALANTNAGLRLFNAECALSDEAVARPSWPAGDNNTKRTMERDAVGFGWHTSVNAGGTPRAANSVPPPPPPPPPAEPPPPPPEPPPPPPPPDPPPPPPLPPPPPADPPPPSGPAASNVNHIVISEIQAGTEANGVEDEFVELYNPTDQPVSLVGWLLKKRSSTGSLSNLVSAGAFSGIIAPRGFFLIAHANYRGVVSRDLVYSANSNNLAYTANAVVLYDMSGVVVDEIGWVEILRNQSIERKAWQGSCVSATGAGENIGNGCDTDNNASDFEIRSIAHPQNSQSPPEP